MTCLDSCNRPINYLRISVTDRCNLRCLYCMPEEGVASRSHQDTLRYEEIEAIARLAVGLGITKLRVTGGEPLVRLGIVDLIRTLSNIPGIDDLSMTTNGILLNRYASDLAQAGLQRINISLDTLRAERFHRFTRLGHLEDVLAAIETSTRVGFKPVKINTVVLRGMNDDEVVDFARKTLDPGWNIRFIELMPVGNNSIQEVEWKTQVVSATETRQQIETALGKLEPAEVPAGAGPARYFQLPGAKGTLGFITPVSHHFCEHCNRLRLTSDGKLRPCLLADQEIDLLPALRPEVNSAQLKALILDGIQKKPHQHQLNLSQLPKKRGMSGIGG